MQAADDLVDRQIPRVRISDLIARHAALLLDAYGVLVDGERALPDAASLITHLNGINKPYFILTNDASRLPENASLRYRALGLPIPAERIMTSGALIPSFLRARGLSGARCVVLGTEDSREYARQAGGVVIDPLAGDHPEAEVVICADERGYPMLETIDAALSLILRAMESGPAPLLLLPNPDLIYPAGEGSFGIAAGSIAAMIEQAIQVRFPDRPATRFLRLGKPHPGIFEEVTRRLGTRDVVMIGDQLETDVRGALDFGIAAAWVETGVIAAADAAMLPLRPTYTLSSIAP